MYLKAILKLASFTKACQLPLLITIAVITGFLVRCFLIADTTERIIQQKNIVSAVILFKS